MTFEEANKGYKKRTEYKLAESDFRLVIDIRSRHICFTCTHREDCCPSKINFTVAECNHYEEKKCSRNCVGY